MNSGKPLRRRRKMQTITMTDVATLASVSPSTVSLYLRKPAEVSEAISERIQAAIDQLGYVPNYVAGGLASAGSRVVSIVVPSIRNAFFSSTVSRIEADLAGQGIQTLVGNNEYSLDVEERLVRAALSWSPAAIVLTGLEHSEATSHLLRQRSIPVIEMWETGIDPLMSSVGFSHREVGQDITKFVLERGRNKPVFVGARLDADRRAAQRKLGYTDVVVAAGGHPVFVEDPRPASTEVGRDALERVLRDFPESDAVICSSDVIALGIVFEASRRGVAIPSRLGITGFGNLEFSGTCNPPITTVEPNSDLIARRVADMILDGIARQDFTSAPRKIVETGFRIVVRDSV